MGHYASEMGFMDDRPERQGKRDSALERLTNEVALIEAEFPTLANDIRTLINEVKERDEALRKIRDRDLEWDDEEGMVAVAEGVIGSKDRPE